MKIAIISINIGKYIQFFNDFYQSFNKLFLPNTTKDYYVFTNSDQNDLIKDDHIHYLYQENLDWPKNTLYRYRMFKRITNRLKEYDYIFFFNANAICKEIITKEEFLPIKEDLLVVMHPSYTNVNPESLPYERNHKSSAYISFFNSHAKYYFAGGVQGGKASAYLKLINDIDEMIIKDEQNEIIALWNDESYLNKYMLNIDNYKILNASYCYPENENLPFTPKILILDKYLINGIIKNNKDHQSYIKQQKYFKSLNAKLARIINKYRK